MSPATCLTRLVGKPHGRHSLTGLPEAVPGSLGQRILTCSPRTMCAPLLKVRKSWFYDAVESGAIEAIRLGKQLAWRIEYGDRPDSSSAVK